MGNIHIGIFISTVLITIPLDVKAESSFENLTLEQLAQQFTTPHTLAQYLKKEFKFKSDQSLFHETDYWQSPEEFIARKRGDCEDYAIFTQHMLMQNGFTALLFSMFGSDGYAHTICVFQDEKKRWNAMNQDKLFHANARTIEELASKINPSWIYGGVVERKGKRGHFVKETHNSDPHPGPFYWEDPFAIF